MLTAQQLYELLVHRKDVFAKQLQSGAYTPVKRPITINDLKDHIDGKVTLGLYCLRKDNTVLWACVDLDGSSDPEVLKNLSMEADFIYELFPEFGRIKEFSGRRGYHVWIIFNKPTSALYAQQLVKSRLNKAGLDRHEVFPKQTTLNENRLYGNLVKIPLAIHRVSGNRAVIEKVDL